MQVYLQELRLGRDSEVMMEDCKSFRQFPAGDVDGFGPAAKVARAAVKPHAEGLLPILKSAIRHLQPVLLSLALLDSFCRITMSSCLQAVDQGVTERQPGRFASTA